jgi:hypothetical protein
MKTALFSSLAALLLVTLSSGCAASSTDAGGDDKNEGDQTSKGDETNKGGDTNKDTPPANPTPDKPADPAPAPAAAIATAKLKDNVAAFVATNDALFTSSTTTRDVERSAPDATAPATLSILKGATQLAVDPTAANRVFALLDKGSLSTLVSVNAADGADLRNLANWSISNGTPTTLAINEGRVYFVATRSGRPADSMIVSTSTLSSAGNATFRVEELVEAKSINPAFTKERLFAVDYFRQSAVRVSLVDTSLSVDIIQQQVPTVAGGITTDGADVYTRTNKGIVKVAVGSGANSEPIVVVPSGTCSIFDPASGAMSNLEDALVIDGTNLYTACRNGTNVEIRAYNAKDGALVKTVATAPWNSSLTHLRITSTAAYWLSRNELWRAAK